LVAAKAVQFTDMVSMSDTWHVDLQAEVDGVEICRPYTPLSTLDSFYQGRLDLLIKSYPTGRMSKHLASMRPGSAVTASGPTRTLDTSQYKSLLVIAGGSAVTVAVQICAAVLKRTFGSAPVHLVLCNNAVGDVLCHDRLDALQKVCRTFSVTHCILQGQSNGFSGGPSVWQSGALNAAAVASVTPHTPAVVSGPPGLCRAAANLLISLGWHMGDVQFLDGSPPPPENGITEQIADDRVSIADDFSDGARPLSLWSAFTALLSCPKRYYKLAETDGVGTQPSV